MKFSPPPKFHLKLIFIEEKFLAKFLTDGPVQPEILHEILFCYKV